MSVKNTSSVKYHRILILTAFLLLCLATSAMAQGEKSTINGRVSPITLVHSLDYPPLFYVDSDGVSQDIMVDYWKLWSAKTGIEIEFDPNPWHIRGWRTSSCANKMGSFRI